MNNPSLLAVCQNVTEYSGVALSAPLHNKNKNLLSGTALLGPRFFSLPKLHYRNFIPPISLSFSFLFFSPHYLFQSLSHNPDSGFKKSSPNRNSYILKLQTSWIVPNKKVYRKYFEFLVKRGHTQTLLIILTLTWTFFKPTQFRNTYYLFFNSPQLVKCFRFGIITKASSYHLHIKQGLSKITKTTIWYS